MKLYAAQHMSTNQWWNVTRQRWQESFCRQCVWGDGDVVDVEGSPKHHRLVTLTRTPELRAEVERYEQALIRALRGCPRTRHGMARCSESPHMVSRNDWCMDCIATEALQQDDLIVLPEET